MGRPCDDMSGATEPTMSHRPAWRQRQRGHVFGHGLERRRTHHAAPRGL